MSSRTKLSEPPETDLDYYARPENYTGSNLNSLTRFLIAKDKAGPKEKKVSKKKKGRDDERALFRRYRHILPPDTCDTSSSSESSSEENDEKDTKRDQERSKKDHHSQFRDTGQNSTKRTKSKHHADGSNLLNSVVKEEEDASSEVADISDTEAESGYGSRMRSYTDPLPEAKLYRTGTYSDDGVTGYDQLDEREENQGHEISQGPIGLHTPSSSSANDSMSSNTDTDITTPDFLSRTTMSSLVRAGSATTRNVPLMAKFISVRSKLTHLSRDAKKRVYQQKFQKLIIGVVNVLKLAKAIIKPTDSPSALLKSFTAMSKEPDKDDPSENMKSYGLHFDPSYYRANKEISVSSEVKNILRLPPNRRSPEQIQTAMFGLQSLPSFAEYPLHMQEKLTKVAWYEIVTPMRTIIRQGHFAENFYFILSGQALVTIHKPGESSAQTAAMMRKGTSFGELALLHHSRRTATVTSHDTVQLLSVGRDDFFDIFMSGHGMDEMPEHIKFISQLDFMKDWPLERLLERPDQCLLHFFKRNMVIIKDSRASEWFYVVKSGTCQVLKQLKGVTGRLGPPRAKPLIPQDNLGNLQTGASLQESRIDTGRRPWRKKPARAVFDVEKFLLDDDQEETMVQSRLQESSDETSDKEAKSEQDFTNRPFSKLRYLKKPRTGTPHFVRSAKRRDSPRQDQTKQQSPRGVHHRQQQQHYQQEQQQQQQQRHQEQQPVFVQIELLKPKDVFGLDGVNFNNDIDVDSSSVSLVSLGAECIMLSKAFFMKHANDRVKKRFSEIVQPYPDEQHLQESLQNKVDWELYKTSLITKVTAPKPTGLRGQPLTTFR